MNPISWLSFLVQNLPPNFHKVWAETFCRVHGFETEGIRKQTIFKIVLYIFSHAHIYGPPPPPIIN